MKLNERLKKIKTNIGGVKTRSLLVILAVVLVLVAILVWTALRDTEGVLEGGSNTKRVKPLDSLPGAGVPSVVYDPLQKAQNKEQAESAKETGGSAVPSLINQGEDGYNRGGFGDLNDGTGRCGDECFDQSGYDAQGYDRNGFDKEGFDRNGYDKDGYDKEGYDRQGYDRDGFNRAGCNRQGMNREGKPCAPSAFGPDCFNDQGKDKNGCNKEGKDATGAVCYNEKGFNKAGFNKCGLDANGYDKDGFDKNGCNKENLNKEGRPCYDANGFTEQGFDRAGFDAEGFGKDGFDRQGFDKNGLNKDGLDRMGFNKNGCNKEGKNRAGLPCANETTDIANLLNQGTGTGAGVSSQAQASAQMERLMAEQRALEQARINELTVQQQQELVAQQQAQIAAFESLMNNQAQALLAAWAPPVQSFIKGTYKKEEVSILPVTDPRQGLLPATGTGPLIHKAGDIVFGIIDTSINSDEPGPVLARIVSGPLKGAKILGTFERQDKKLMLTFTTVSVPDVPQSIAIDAIAIDPETARTALATDVDNHYLLKYGSLIAASFLEGMGQAVETSIGTPTLSGSDSATITTTNAATTRDQVIVGIGKAGQRIATEIDKSNIQPTVTLVSGTGVGLLIMSDFRIEEPPPKQAPPPAAAAPPATAPPANGQNGTTMMPPPAAAAQASMTAPGMVPANNAAIVNSTTVNK